MEEPAQITMYRRRFGDKYADALLELFKIVTRIPPEKLQAVQPAIETILTEIHAENEWIEGCGNDERAEIAVRLLQKTTKTISRILAKDP